jgi:hypothetical protein
MIEQPNNTILTKLVKLRKMSSLTESSIELIQEQKMQALVNRTKKFPFD